MIHTRKRTSLLLTFILLLSLFLLPFTYVKAQEESPFSLKITPGYHEIVIPENEATTQVSTTIQNTSSQNLILSPSLLNVIPKEGSEQLQLTEKDTAYSLRPFSSFPEQNILISAGEKKDISVQFNSTKMASGGYYGVLIFEARIADGETKGKSAAIPAISTMLFVTKQGDLKPQLELQSVNWPQYEIVFSLPQEIQLTFLNKGNVHLIPYGRIEMYDLFQRLVSKGVLNESSKRILPGSEKTIEVALIKTAPLVPFSLNTMIIQVRDSHNLTNYTFHKKYLYINPIGLIVIFLSFSILIWKRKKLYHYGKQFAERIKKKSFIKPTKKY